MRASTHTGASALACVRVNTVSTMMDGCYRWWWMSVKAWFQQRDCLDECYCRILAEWMLLHECCGSVPRAYRMELIWKEIVFLTISHFEMQRTERGIHHLLTIALQIMLKSFSRIKISLFLCVCVWYSLDVDCSKNLSIKIWTLPSY